MEKQVTEEEDPVVASKEEQPLPDPEETPPQDDLANIVNELIPQEVGEGMELDPPQQEQEETGDAKPSDADAQESVIDGEQEVDKMETDQQSTDVVPEVTSEISETGVESTPTTNVEIPTNAELHETDLEIPNPDQVPPESSADIPVSASEDPSSVLQQVAMQETSLDNQEQPEDQDQTSTDGVLHENSMENQIGLNQPARNKPKSGTFSLGVPGLTFSAQNLKIANDGTKMVQIHQSQITPNQLQALQANPNIKVVFRHIPTGKSFSKPPKNLFSCLSKQQGVKRKISEEMEEPDDSIYNFGEDLDDTYSYASKPKTNIAKHARYSPNVGFKKRGPGRPKLIPDAVAVSSGFIGKMRPPAIPAQIMLTDAIAKLNKLNALYTVKIHIKQVTHDILNNMELHPDYNLVLTSKSDPGNSEDQSLENLVKEWEEKEVEDLHKEKEEVSEVEQITIVPEFTEAPITTAPIPTAPITTSYSNPILFQDEDDEDVRIMDEDEKREAEEREREEAEILAAAMQEKKSRSGRIRKPSRYSLDIARLTRRRNNDDVSPDEDYMSPPPLPPPQFKVTPKPATPSSGGIPGKKRGRGRPRKPRPGDENYVSPHGVIETPVKMEETQESPVETPKAPVVIMSPSDKNLAEKVRLKSDDEEEKSPSENIEESTSAQEEDTKSNETKEKPDESKGEEKMECDEIKTTSEKEEKTDGDETKGEEKKNDDITKDGSEEPEKVDEDKNSEAEKKEDAESSSLDKPEAAENAESSSDKPKAAENAESLSDKPEAAENAESASDKPEESKENAESASDKPEESKENAESSLDKPSEENAESEKKDESSSDQVVRKISSDGETPSDILARKLEMSVEKSSTDGKSEEESKPRLTDFVEEEGDVDNKFRLRKLLQQCTIEEIRSVAIPKALDAITLGDFFLHKADQMSSQKASFTSLYKQLENLHSAIEKESIRYNTLLRRANKVGGDRRMDKVILMPVYNKKAAESVDINSSSIDAHIGGIQQKSTAQMIAANSFRMNCKMDPPRHRLKLPDLADKGQMRNKRRQTAQKFPRHPEPDSTTPDQPSFIHRSFTGSRLPGNNWSKPYQVRKPSYLLGSSKGIAHSTLQEQARMQLVGRYQTQKDNSAVDSSTPTSTTDQVAQSSEIGTSASVSDLNHEILPQVIDGDSANQVVDDDGTTVLAAEEGKQLVAIGDGQYVELPEGYTLIQTDDGYIIGQPGATFVQGEDGNVYMTSSEETTEATQQVLTTTAQIGDGETPTASTDALLEELSQT